jgi:hypothetical protein
MKKAVMVLVGILMIGSAEPARAVNIPDWAIAGIATIVDVVAGLIDCFVCFNLLSGDPLDYAILISTLSLIVGGSTYGSMKATKYFERKREREEEEKREGEEVKRNWLGIKKKG